jgi:heat shock transcription factor
MFGPLSPNPAAPIQLPEHEWLDMLGGGEPLGGGTETTAVGRTGPMIRSASRDDDMAGSDPDQSQNAPGHEPDQFVSSILERGPSLDTQMSLGFLERMSSAEIGDMVKDMNINQPLDDEFARRIREIKS